MLLWLQTLAVSNSGSQETHRPGMQEERLSRAESLRSLHAPSMFCWSDSPSMPSEPLLTWKVTLQNTLPWSCGPKNPYPYLTLYLKRRDCELSPCWRGRITWLIRAWIPEKDYLGLNPGYDA